MDMALQRAQLTFLIAARISLAEKREQRLRLQGLITPQLILHPWPIGLKRILSRPVNPLCQDRCRVI
jgi:hypothetical protein